MDEDDGHAGLAEGPQPFVGALVADGGDEGGGQRREGAQAVAERGRGEAGEGAGVAAGEGAGVAAGPHEGGRDVRAQQADADGQQPGYVTVQPGEPVEAAADGRIDASPYHCCASRMSDTCDAGCWL